MKVLGMYVSKKTGVLWVLDSTHPNDIYRDTTYICTNCTFTYVTRQLGCFVILIHFWLDNIYTHRIHLFLCLY